VKKVRVAKVMGAGVVAGAAFAVWRAYRARVPQARSDTTWEPAPFPFPPIPRPRVIPEPPAADDPAEPDAPVVP